MSGILETPQINNYGADFMPVKIIPKEKSHQHSRRAAGCKKGNKVNKASKNEKVNEMDETNGAREANKANKNKVSKMTERNKASKNKEKRYHVSFEDSTSESSEPNGANEAKRTNNYSTYKDEEVLAPVDESNYKTLASGNFDIFEAILGGKYLGNNSQYKSFKLCSPEVKIAPSLTLPILPTIIEAVEFTNTNTSLIDLTSVDQPIHFNRCIFKLTTNATGHACIRLGKGYTQLIDCTLHLNIDNTKLSKLGPNALFVSTGCNLSIDTSTFYIVYSGSKADARILHIKGTQVQSKVEIKRCTAHVDFKVSNSGNNTHSLTFAQIIDGTHNINIYENTINANSNVMIKYNSFVNNSKDSKINYDNNTHNLIPINQWKTDTNKTFNLFKSYNPNPIVVQSNYNITDSDRSIIVAGGELVLPPASKSSNYIDMFIESDLSLKDSGKDHKINGGSYIRCTPKPDGNNWIIIKT